ncbi:MAG: hypothetical protein F4Y03_05495 [Alphaproteobacteria bacterium]|nr:hypothetical protein [Alphaproteobacteria bacterium]
MTPELPANASRDEILEALSATPEHDIENRVRLWNRFTAAPSAPAIKVRHGGRPGTMEIWQDGRWQAG